MSDQARRELERTAELDPVARERLEREWLRAGLGWRGEELPPYLVPKGDLRGVYDYRYRVKHDAPGSVEIFVKPNGIEFVYVPGTEIKCPTCMPSSIHYLGREGRSCPDCGGANWKRIAPFYVGRYPVLCWQWWEFAKGVDDVDRPNSPINGVTLSEALRFAGSHGARLLTRDEWLWACLGAPVGCPTCFGADGTVCQVCRRTGKRQRAYPWGFGCPNVKVCAAMDPDTPSDATSVDSCVPDQCDPQCPYTIDVSGAAGAPCVCGAQRRLVPAHPLGVSWCAAHDMVGNVRELVTGGRLFASSGAFDRMGFGCRDRGVLDTANGARQIFGTPVRLDALESFTVEVDWSRSPDSGLGFRIALDAKEAA